VIGRLRYVSGVEFWTYPIWQPRVDRHPREHHDHTLTPAYFNLIANVIRRTSLGANLTFTSAWNKSSNSIRKRCGVYRPRPILYSKMLVLTSFENDLGWAPSLDGRASFARMPLA